MVEPGCCDWCGTYLSNKRCIPVGDNWYCQDCFARAQRMSGQVDGAGDAWTWLLRGSLEPPTSPAKGQIWVDLAPLEPTPMMWDGEAWVDLISGAEYNKHGERVARKRYAGVTIKQMIIDEIIDFPSSPDPTPLTMWVIYKNPSDYAGRTKGDVYVLRRWSVTAHDNRPDHKAVAWGSYEKVLAQVPPGLVCMKAAPDDDPAVYETWF